MAAFSAAVGSTGTVAVDCPSAVPRSCTGSTWLTGELVGMSARGVCTGLVGSTGASGLRGALPVTGIVVLPSSISEIAGCARTACDRATLFQRVTARVLCMTQETQEKKTTWKNLASK